MTLFQGGRDLVAELRGLLDSGASPEELAAHPSLARAIAAMEAVPATNAAPDFGTAEFFDRRVYRASDGLDIVGIEALLDEADRVSAKYAGGEVRQDRRIHILLGPPAAGKSTIAERMAREHGARIINSDDIKKMIPEFQGGIGAQAVHEESSVLAREHLERSVSHGDNIILPKVGADPVKMRRDIRSLEADGYEVHLVEMRVAPDEAFRRMIRRFIETGRLVDPSYALGVADRLTLTHVALREEGIADGYQAFDNNVPFGSSPILIEQIPNPERRPDPGQRANDGSVPRVEGVGRAEHSGADEDAPPSPRGLKPPRTLYQPAYHGSPHIFDRFSSRVAVREFFQRRAEPELLPGVDLAQPAPVVEITAPAPDGDPVKSTKAILAGLRDASVIMSDGTEVRFSGRGLRKLGSFRTGDGQMRARVTAQIEDLLRAAVVYGEGPDT